MTAEVAILNKNCVILAADSALTIGNSRVWKQASKVFNLCPGLPVGVMFYGSGDFLGVPWEVILKTYRKTLTSEDLSVQTHCERFIEYLGGIVVPPSCDDKWAIKKLIIDTVDELASLNQTSRRERRREVIERAHFLTEYTRETLDPSSLADADSDDFREMVESASDVVFKDVLLTRAARNAILEATRERLRRQFETPFHSGVVFAGFGPNDFFPSAIHVKIDGRLANNVRWWTVDAEDLNGDEGTSAVILTLAQNDVAHLFMEGIAWEQVAYIFSQFDKVLELYARKIAESFVEPGRRAALQHASRGMKEDIVREMMKAFAAFREVNFADPITQVVATLPKEEAAELAAALVEITSLKRKFDAPLETVGGPVDVAIISRADGFIWKQRKHYFDIDKNRDFDKLRLLVPERRANGGR